MSRDNTVYKATGHYLFNAKKEPTELEPLCFIKTYDKLLSNMIKFTAILLIKGYPDEYGHYAKTREWFALTPKDALSLLNDAFAKGLITSKGERYESARDAWGKYPDKITAEIPETKLFVDFELFKEEDAKMYVKRCEDCMWNATKRKMPWCTHKKINQACKNVETCPEGIW